MPSKVAAADQPLNHFISAKPMVRAESRAYAALLTTKLEPGSVWKLAPTVRSELKSSGEAAAQLQDRIL